MIDADHKTGPMIAGRFDLWAVKVSDDDSTTAVVQVSDPAQKPIQIGQCYKFEALNVTNNFMLFSRKDSGMYSQQNGSLTDSTFKALAGKDESIAGGITFESTSVPNRFLRHWATDKVSLHANDTQNIEKDSTFIVKTSLVSMKGIQLEASNEPRNFLVN